MDFAAEFPVLARCTFLSHAGVSPLPRRAADAIHDFAEEAVAEGSAAYPKWATRLKKAREEAGVLLGVDESEIGFVHNTTHGVLCVANSLPWRAGDNLVLAAHEFPANVQPWRQLRERGVAIRTVPERPDHTYSLDDFAAAIDSRTRVVAVSLVQYASGYRMPAEGLAELCHARGALLFLDAIQAVGAMPTRVADLGCDFLAADGQKWMLGIEGHAVMWVRPELIDLMNESMTGWVGRTRPWDYENYDQPLLRSARRFEEGAYNMAAAAALSASLGLINEYGIENVWRNNEALTARVCEGALRMGFKIASPRGDGERSGIVCLDLCGRDATETAKRLAEQGIHVAPRRGWLRVSAHFYNSSEQIDALLAALSNT